MELMILKQNKYDDIYLAGFNRHEWLAFGNYKRYTKFLAMIGRENRSSFDIFGNSESEDEYSLAFIDLKTAKAVDKEFGFEGSFIRAFKERVAK